MSNLAKIMGQSPLTITQQCVLSLGAGFETLRAMSTQDEEHIQLGNNLQLTISRHNPDLLVISRTGLGHVEVVFGADALDVEVRPEKSARSLAEVHLDRLDLVEVDE